MKVMFSREFQQEKQIAAWHFCWNWKLFGTNSYFSILFGGDNPSQICFCVGMVAQSPWVIGRTHDSRYEQMPSRYTTHWNRIYTLENHERARRLKSASYGLTMCPTCCWQSCRLIPGLPAPSYSSCPENDIGYRTPPKIDQGFTTHFQQDFTCSILNFGG